MTPQLFSGRSDQAEISLKSRKGGRHVWDNPSSCFLARHILMAHHEHGRLYSGNWTGGKGWTPSSSSRACHLSQVTHQKARRQGTRQRGRLERSPGCYGRSWYRRVLAKDKKVFAAWRLLEARAGGQTRRRQLDTAEGQGKAC